MNSVWREERAASWRQDSQSRPLAAALAVAIAALLLLPPRFRLGLGWLVPAAEALLLAATLVADRSHGAHRSAIVRALSFELVFVLIAAAAFVTGRLVVDLVEGGPETPDLAFPQQLSPNVAPPGWRPEFPDYLYLGFTNATAFSPTDVMPLARWSKLAMTVQAAASLVILGLVVARAVNIFR
jgi:hypothetical protein